MFENDLSCLEENEVDVKVFSNSGIYVGEGKLVFSKNQIPHVSFGLLENIKKFTNNTYFICKVKNKIYTLLNCEVDNNTIIPKIIVQGEKKQNRFKKVSVLFQGISEWMDIYSRFEGTQGEIIRILDNDTFDVLIDSKDGRFSITCEHWWDTGSLGNSSYKLNIRTLITIEKEHGHWSSQQVIELVHDLKRIFTLLLGYPSGIEYVFDRSHDKKMQSIYFLNQTAENITEFRPSSCFVSSGYLFAQKKWPIIFNHYFCSNPNEFQVIWSRVAGMFSYSGFWEYKILAYVSLLDKYVSCYAKKYDSSITDGEFTKIRRKMRESIKSFKREVTSELTSIDIKYNEVLESIDKQLEKFDNSKFSSFSEKFNLVIEALNKDVRKIIDFSTNDFKHLKKLRDFIAHGGEPPTKSDIDLTYEITMTSKLALLLLYWTYKDLGFSDEDYITFLGNWQHPLVAQARLKADTMDELLSRGFYLKMNKTNFSKIMQRQYLHLVLRYVKSSDSYRFDAEATMRLQNWHKNFNKENRSVQEELMSYVDTGNVKNIAYVSNAYAQHGERKSKIHSAVCILNCPDKIALHKLVFNHLKIFDDNSSQWLPSEFEKNIATRKTTKISN